MISADMSATIAATLAALCKAFPARSFFRQSGGTGPWSAVNEESTVPAFDCPEQSGKLPDCASCGLCFNPNVTKSVRFYGHARALRPDHPALLDGLPLFKGRADADDPRPLKRGSTKSKLGPTVRKGRLTGAWIFTLTLPERETCPRSCHHWADCYGNNMYLAKRHTPTPEFLANVRAQIAGWPADRQHLIRLHVLGDFYSPEYVDFWSGILADFPNVSLFGYTAHPVNDYR